VTCRVPVASLLTALLFLPPVPAAEPTYAEVRGLLDAHCAKCHGEMAQKAGVNFAPLKDEKAALRLRKLWRSVVGQLESGEMPPEDQKQPTPEQRQRFVAWAKGALAAVEKADRERPDPGRSLVRRLNRSEYNRTVRDLTGIDIDPAGAVGMPDETVGEAFDNLAAALSLSAAQMEKYFAAAELVLDRLYPVQKGKTQISPALAKLIAAKPGEKLAPRETAAKVLERFARRAYRRPVETREVERLMKLYDLAAKEGTAHEEALRPALKAVLVSPNFLLRIERDRAADPDTAYRVGDHELAARLSYFLWSSMPDAELTLLADNGELSKPEVLEAQVRRLLADPKARALTDNFAVQWLRLKKISLARPSTEFFPTFTSKLRQAMYDEAATFFDKLRAEDRPVLDLLAADYVYVNADLAKHYGIAGVTGNELRKVTLSDPNRGGLLGMGGILALTSHTSRTSPTLRGKYVLDVILGTPPPPPPPNVSQIDEKKKGKEAQTFREQLALHAANATCAGCHSKIDPLGFGLENFDAVGQWHPAGPGVDATGKLPTGETFNGPKDLKQVLLARKNRFAENLTEKLFVYALGRELQPTDEATIKTIVQDVEKDGYRFSRVVLGIVQSYPFQYRRNLKNDETE
jgi:hypothetical protein